VVPTGSITEEPSVTHMRERTLGKMAPQAGLEPATLRLTVAARCSNTTLDRASSGNRIGLRSVVPAFHTFVLNHFEFRREWAQKWAQISARSSSTHAGIYGIERNRILVNDRNIICPQLLHDCP